MDKHSISITILVVVIVLQQIQLKILSYKVNLIHDSLNKVFEVLTGQINAIKYIIDVLKIDASESAKFNEFFDSKSSDDIINKDN